MGRGQMVEGDREGYLSNQATTILHTCSIRKRAMICFVSCYPVRLISHSSACPAQPYLALLSQTPDCLSQSLQLNLLSPLPLRQLERHLHQGAQILLLNKWTNAEVFFCNVLWSPEERLLVSLGVTEASIFLMLIFLRKRVRVAIALLREASKAIGHIMSTLFFPVITFLLLAVCISYWAVTAVHLASSGEAIYKVMSPDVSCPYANSTCNPKTFNKTNISKSALCLDSQCLFAFYGGETSYHRYLFLLQLFNLLVFFWLVNFSLALEQCTLAGTFASYYWARRKPQDIPPCPLFSSFSRTVRYHTGSLAFGALILSVAQLVQIILEYLEQKLKGVDNSLSRFIMHCLKCCFWCLEKFLRYMNRNAYIMVAIYGKNFCTSAREAFFLLMRNMVRVAILDSVTDFLLFLGKVLIAGGVGVVVFFFFNRKIPVFQEEVPNLNYYWVPLLTVVICAYLIAHGFFNVYAMCVDTLFLCFCDDLERHDGSSEKPFLMSPELHRILGKSSQLH
uniref:choline transporter-like protein 5-A n=1 Tax=Epinephelus lanceolatus TaxID=310571 RepID=UPI001447E47B|nr:choline transporter-like protein 5-A [Epinephelus lanceolatus]